ncbi:MAG TPA: hypothetical protein PLW35_04295 [Verrucomicrobiota bacterium]|nr:hypothetical protein [Verrucomicrobiota bacterium]
MKLALTLSLAAGLLAHGPCALSETVFQTDFESSPIDKLPPEFTPVEGNFVVREQDGNRFIESPGAPVDSYILLFGPAMNDNVSVLARVFGTAKGRRYPTFAIGLNGAAGYRLQVSPGRKEIGLHKGDQVKVSAQFDWKPGEWLWLRLEIARVKDNTWRVRGKAWLDGTTEPQSWALSIEDNAPPRSGRAVILACPIAGTPVRFDDLKLDRIGP